MKEIQRKEIKTKNTFTNYSRFVKDVKINMFDSNCPHLHRKECYSKHTLIYLLSLTSCHKTMKIADICSPEPHSNLKTWPDL